MSLFRWVIGLPVAALVTAGLFFMMAELIKDKGVDLQTPRQAPDLRITADPPPEGRAPPVKPKPLPTELPEIELDFPKQREVPTGPVVTPNPEPVKIDTTTGSMPISGPIIKITPAYPEGCRSKSAQGVVVVQFDITPEGNVTNPQIIESPDRCFDRPIRNAVAKWKYPPSSGRNAMRYGMVETFSFQLVD